MENDQAAPPHNDATNHREKVADANPEQIKTTPTSFPQNTANPPSVNIFVSPGTAHVTESVGTSYAHVAMDENTNEEAAPLGQGESSLAQSQPGTRPLASFQSASRSDFLPPLSDSLSKSHARSRTESTEIVENSSGLGSQHPPFPLSKATTPAKNQVPSANSKSSTPISSTDPSPTVTDEQSIQDEKIKTERRPLTDKYGSYICATDTSLQDAQLRLHTAMEQTRRLRQAFTDRVYKKYRVCLEPIPTTQESLTGILSYPQACLVQLEQRIHQLAEEKAAEKREAASLNTEMTQAPEREKVERITNAENAEQLMYISAGLSVIVLPEDETVDVSKWYTDRAPTHPTTGQRVKGISAAAATAGEVMLDRKRKGALLRKERLNQQSSRVGNSDYSRLQFLVKNPTFPVIIPSATVSTSAIDGNAKEKPGSSVVSTAPSKGDLIDDSKIGTAKSATTKKGTARASAAVTSATSAATAKAIRARVQATMSVQTLLSLSPTGEELRTDGKLSAATLALMERGIGTLTSKSHPRHRHPYPESAGGKRRALHGGNCAPPTKDSASLAWSLPPLPTVKERRSRKRLRTPTQATDLTGAKDAIHKVLMEFDAKGCGKRQKLSEISFLHGIQNFDRKPPAFPSMASPTVNQNDGTRKIDPMLAFHVMRAVGFIQCTESDKESPVIFPANLDKSMFPIAEKRAMGDEGGVSRRSISILRVLYDKFTSADETLADRILRPSLSGENSAVVGIKAPVVPIRGGGEALNENAGEKEGDSRGRHNSVAVVAAPNLVGTIMSNGASGKLNAPIPRSNQGQATSPQACVLNDQSRLILLNAGQGTQPVSRVGQYPNVDRYYPNAVQLANQLRLSRIPNPGYRGQSDLSEYIGSLHPQAASGYDWSAVNAASAAAAASAQSLASLGIAPHRASLVNFPLQDSARAMLHDPSAAAAAVHAAAAHQQQQALAYLSSGYSNTGGPRFQSNMGTAMMSQVFLNHAGLQNVQMRQQQLHSRSPHQVHHLPIPDPSSSVPMGREPDAKDTHPEKYPDGPVYNGPDTSSNNKKRHAPPRDTDIPQEIPKRTKVTSSNESKAVSKVAPALKAQTGGSNAADSSDTKSPAQHTESTSSTSFTVSKTMTPNPYPKTSPSVSSSTPAKSLPAASTGLHFFVPPAPPEIPTDIASKILESQSHEVTGKLNSLSRSEKSAVVAYLVAVGTAVPIPKTLVANLLKDKLNASTLRGASMSGIPQSSREAAVATILLWLWKTQEDCFQRAFAKSGRIDVEPECKWLLAAAVDKTIAALGQAMDDPASRTTTPLAIALMAIKSKTSNLKGTLEKDSSNFLTASLDLLVVSAISKGLNAGFMLSRQVDATLPFFNELLEYVDEIRKSALYSKSQERSLLAALISRKATMSLSFSHAYVSAMVRAGEALGHGELFEVIQNEDVNVSTMIPYDVFTDEYGAWEDPCRPQSGFNSSLTGDDLMRQAHARAMIQKSLKKLQERHNIKGGTLISGAYIDPPAPNGASDTKPTTAAVSGASRASHPKKRSSFSEKPIQAGTGSAPATTWLLYEPKHSSSPLDWNAEIIENAPYGKHDVNSVPRSLSVSQFSMKLPVRGRSRSLGTSSTGQAEQVKNPDPDDGPIKRSTREIPWIDVADIFQNVNMPGTPRPTDVPITPRGRTIFAPTIRQVKIDDLGVDSADESDEDEDFRDEAVLARHQVVLDNMKEHLSAFFASREKNSQEKRGRKSSHS